MELIKELQDWGLFVINPIQYAKRASNKYTSSVLLERYEIPQPKFALLQKIDIEEGEESLKKKLELIYDDLGQDEKADKKKEYVVKILDGHGGTGVFMVTGKTILSVLQTIFAIDPERELLLQRKEEADVRNEAEQLIFMTEKSIKDLKDRLEGSDIEAIKKCVDLLKEGNVLSVFPQGSLQDSHDITAIKGGVILLAIKSDNLVLFADLFENCKNVQYKTYRKFI